MKQMYLNPISSPKTTPRCFLSLTVFKAFGRITMSRAVTALSTWYSDACQNPSNHDILASMSEAMIVDLSILHENRYCVCRHTCLPFLRSRKPRKDIKHPSLRLSKIQHSTRSKLLKFFMSAWRIGQSFLFAGGTRLLRWWPVPNVEHNFVVIDGAKFISVAI